MESIYAYIAFELQSPETAIAQFDRIAFGIESLGNFPERCRSFASDPDRKLGMRQLRIDNYSVIFVVERNRVTVIRVLYSASDILSRLSKP